MLPTAAQGSACFFGAEHVQQHDKQTHTTQQLVLGCSGCNSDGTGNQRVRCCTASLQHSNRLYRCISSHMTFAAATGLQPPALPCAANKLDSMSNQSVMSCSSSCASITQKHTTQENQTKGLPTAPPTARTSNMQAAHVPRHITYITQL
jgi:hypothetical protein